MRLTPVPSRDQTCNYRPLLPCNGNGHCARTNPYTTYKHYRNAASQTCREPVIFRPIRIIPVIHLIARFLFKFERATLQRKSRCTVRRPEPVIAGPARPARMHRVRVRWGIKHLLFHFGISPNITAARMGGGRACFTNDDRRENGRCVRTHGTHACNVKAHGTCTRLHKLPYLIPIY